MFKSLFIVALTIFLLAGCVYEQQETFGAKPEDHDGEYGGYKLERHQGPLTDLMVPNDTRNSLAGEDNRQSLRNQRNYGWHEHRMDSVRPGRLQGRPNAGHHFELNPEEAENLSGENYQGSSSERVKQKLENLNNVYSAYVVDHDNRLYIGLETASVDDQNLKEVVDIIMESEDLSQYTLHTDRRSVHRIRAAEKTMGPHQNGSGPHEWFEDIEYELQKVGDNIMN